VQPDPHLLDKVIPCLFDQVYSDSAEIRIKPLPIARKAILLHR
jgi:hypothetical protein